jgi:hypothetical protein
MKTVIIILTVIILLIVGFILYAFVCFWNYCAHKNDFDPDPDADLFFADNDEWPESKI